MCYFFFFTSAMLPENVPLDMTPLQRPMTASWPSLWYVFTDLLYDSFNYMHKCLCNAVPFWILTQKEKAWIITCMYICLSCLKMVYEYTQTSL